MKVYSLSHPTTKEVRYIGVTSGTLNQRLSQHIWDSKNKMSHKCNWIKSVVLETGQVPIIELLDETEDWELIEQYWISQFKSWGFSLVNTDSGGKGVYKDVRGRSRSIDAHKKHVFQYELDGTYIRSWDSLVEANKYYGTTKGTIGECAKGRSKSSCGFRWSFKKTDKLDSQICGRSDQYKVTLTKDNIVTTFTSKQKAEKFLGHKLNTKKAKLLGYKIELIKI